MKQASPTSRENVNTIAIHISERLTTSLKAAPADSFPGPTSDQSALQRQTEE